VKVSAIVVGILILVFLVLQLTGIAGDHGPGRHSSAGLTPPAGWLANDTGDVPAIVGGRMLLPRNPGLGFPRIFGVADSFPAVHEGNY
jgi:hypothetical protein